MIDWWNANQATAIEAVAVLLGVIYVILAAFERREAWPVGIVGSGLSVFLFMDARLYSEASLYVIYVLMGLYGWWSWRGPSTTDAMASQRAAGELQAPEAYNLPIHTLAPKWHGAALMVTAVMALALGMFFYKGTDAASPFLDATTTSAAIVATILTARKVLGNWIWWIAIDAVSVYLYASRGLTMYAGLMAVYTVIAAAGYLKWRAIWKEQQAA